MTEILLKVALSTITLIPSPKKFSFWQFPLPIKLTHDMTEILLKVALNTITLTPSPPPTILFLFLKIQQTCNFDFN
jgi:hypothetical protein